MEGPDQIPKGATLGAPRFGVAELFSDRDGSRAVPRARRT